MLDRGVLYQILEVCKQIGTFRERLGEYEGTKQGEGIEKHLKKLETEYQDLLEELDG